MTARLVARFSSRHAPCFVGSLDGDLHAMAKAIHESVMHRNGEEFVVWVDADGYVFVSPDTTRAARHVIDKRPESVVNNYRARLKIRGMRFPLAVESIIEDLEFHKSQQAKA